MKWIKSFLFGAVFFSFVGCASNGVDPHIVKVKYYHLKPQEAIITADPAIPFERRHFLYGAITGQEHHERFGHYYSVFWKDPERTGPAKLVFEFRQRNTGSQIKKVEEIVQSPKSRNVTRFRVTGDAYTQGGLVSAWRVRIFRGAQLLTSDQSFMWE